MRLDSQIKAQFLTLGLPYCRCLGRTTDIVHTYGAIGLLLLLLLCCVYCLYVYSTHLLCDVHLLRASLGYAGLIVAVDAARIHASRGSMGDTGGRNNTNRLVLCLGLLSDHFELIAGEGRAVAAEGGLGNTDHALWWTLGRVRTEHEQETEQRRQITNYTKSHARSRCAVNVCAM